MSQVCRAAKCIEAIRVTLLDQCTLLPVCGPLKGYAMGCIIEPSWSPEIEEGEESIVKDNCGEICLRDDRCDLTKRWNVEFKIKEPDAEFLALIEGNPLIVSGGVSIGVRQLAYGACSPYVFLELFERTDDCQTDGDAIYLRHIFPATRLKWTGNEREGIFRILDIEGKTSPVATDSIGTGPYQDIPVGTLVGASASETIDYAWFEDEFLPTVQCGSIDVPCPGPSFTSITSPAPCTVRIDGDFTDVDSVSYAFSTFGLVYFYAPTSPNFGANPVGTVINEWSTTGIEIYLPDICDDCVESVQFWYYDGSEVEFGPATPISPCEPVLAVLTYDQEVMADNPGAWWLLNEASSPAIDSIAGDALTETGPLTWNAGALRSGGDSVTGWGVGQTLERAAIISFTPSAPFTIEAIADIGPSNPSSLAVIYDYQGQSTGVFFYIDTAGKLVGRVGPTAAMLGTIALSLNTPHHIALVADGSDYQFYVDGVTYGPLTAYTGFNIVAGSGPIFVGQTATGGEFTPAGRISDVAEYPSALSAARIAAHYAAM